jgi:two-component system, sensor histidine kinase and response regulator
MTDQGNGELGQLSPTSDLLVWDREATLHRIGDSEELLAQLVDLVIADLPLQIDNLEQALEQKNIKSAMTLAHTIKGMTANLGGLRVQKYSGDLEAACNDNSMGNVEEDFSSLKAAAEELLVVFRSESAK